jgi:hypothetical protein
MEEASRERVMNDLSPEERRERPDRRRKNLPIWHPRRLRGRRRETRRGEQGLVDRVSGRVFLMATLLLVLTLVDGVITLILIDLGCEEANPVMRYLLDKSPGLFFAGKYGLTAAFLPVALVMNRYRLFGTRLRAGHLIPIVAGMYVILIAYQAALWRDHQQAAEPAETSPRLSREIAPPIAGTEG